jgi:hypothetical protein
VLLQALKAKNLEQKSAHEVEIASLRAQSKREISALESKLAMNSSQYAYAAYLSVYIRTVLMHLQFGLAEEIVARDDHRPAERSAQSIVCAEQFAPCRASSHPC